MSQGSGPEGTNPLEALPFYEELARTPADDGVVHWDVARRVAVWVAAGGMAERAVDLVEGATLLELSRVAELQVAAVTGLSTSVTGRAMAVVPATRGQWAVRAVEAHRPLLDAMATALAGTEEHREERPGGLAPPVLEGLVFGWMIGQLARRSIGQYDLPLPRPPSDELAVVPANYNRLATDWGLPGDDVRVWVCLNDVAHHAVLGVEHVFERLATLLFAYVRAYDVGPSALADELGQLDPADPASFRAVLGEPDTVVSAVQSPEQARVLERLDVFTAVIEGYVGWVVDRIGGQLIGTYPQLQEAVRRHRAETSWGDRYVARLLGLELRQPTYERGAVFVRGVLERGGEAALARLWEASSGWPTPAEVDAPGLWLARLKLSAE